MGVRKIIAEYYKATDLLGVALHNAHAGYKSGRKGIKQMIDKHYTDFYNATASIKERKNGKFVLTVKGGNKLFAKKEYVSLRGARIAMGKMSDCWQENNS